MAGPFRRLYHIRPLSALLLALPGLLLCVWYAASAYVRFDRYRRLADAKEALTVEGFQLQLFDVLRRDHRRFFRSPPPVTPHARVVGLHLSAANHRRLLESAHLEAKRPYVKARLERGAEVIDLEVRLRGQQHWHKLGPKRTLKVRLPKGSLFDGHRVFNLIAHPGPMVVDEELILELARRQGALVPHTAFARVEINGRPLGVYHLETQVDESLLRRSRRVPGSIYSGNLPPSAKTDELWSGTTRWKKVAWRDPDDHRDQRNLARLLHAITGASNQEFSAFARDAIDLEAFARVDALDVAFGSDQHDWRHDHKLHFDPYRGRWQPVAWSFRGFRHAPTFNQVENPLLLRLKLLPEYLSLRHRLLYQLLVGDGSTPALTAHAESLLRRLGPELAADPYWSAYQLLPGGNRFYRRMLRPMDLRRLGLVVESELVTYGHRRAFLLRELEQNPLYLQVGAALYRRPYQPRVPTPRSLVNADRAPAARRGARATEPVDVPLTLIIDGRTGVRLTSFEARFDASCREPRWRVEGAQGPLTPWSTSTRVELETPLDLYPTVALEALPQPSRRRGKVRAVMSPVAYPLRLASRCPPVSVEAQGLHLATHARVRSRPAPAAVVARLPQHRLAPGDVPRLAAGEVGPHPDLLRPPPPAAVTLGPGVVAVPKTRVYGPRESVVVAPGTTLTMAPGASLIFRGRVTMRGTREQPILIKGSGSAPWGGIALQGAGTAGSRWSHVTVRGGTTPAWGHLPYPGMVNLHDTRDLVLEHCRLGHSSGGDDLLHAAYVDGLTIEDSVIHDAASDAIDLEFVTAELRHLEIRKAGDDGLDLMGAKVQLIDSVVRRCRGNGISAGEETVARVRGTLVAQSKVGVLAKNGSSVDLSGTLLYRDRTGVEVYTRTVRYEADSQVEADALFVVGSKHPVERRDRKRQGLNRGRIQRRLPPSGHLDHLRNDVLNLETWSRLDAWLDARPSRRSP